MTKYGRGLNREIVAAVNKCQIAEPFSIADVKKKKKMKGWDPSPTDNYINVTLANATSEDHSHTYKKYFRSAGKGKYKLRRKYRGEEWL